MSQNHKKLVVITSREPYNEEGNSHMHYLEVLMEKFNVVFINPPEVWPPKNLEPLKVSDSLRIFKYYNVFPVRFYEHFFAGLNDLLTNYFLNRFIKREFGDESFLLWQFDPYYLNKLSFLNVYKKLYFPLDAYFRDSRDAYFAKRADLLVTVNSTFIDSYYHKQAKDILLFPHGFGSAHENCDLEKVKVLNHKYGDYLIFTGSISFGVDLSLMEKIADEIYPQKLIILGKILIDESLLQNLFGKENVVYLGSKSYKELKNYVSAASFCIVVYDLETNTWRNPIKITDYLAQGKPIVNTVPLKDLLPLEGKALFTSNKEDEFLQLIKKGSQNELKPDQSFIKSWKEKYNYKNLLKTILERIDY